MKSYSQPASLCLLCGYHLNRALGPATGGPSPGDITICLNCGALSQYDVNLRQRPASPDALAGLSLDKRLKLEKALRYIAARGPIDRRGWPS